MTPDPSAPTAEPSPSTGPDPLAGFCAELREDPSGPDLGDLYWLLSEMCWPGDPLRREAFFGTFFAAIMDHATRTLPFKEPGSSSEEPGGLETFHEMVQLLAGGWQAWISLSRPGGVVGDFRNRMRDGRRAGSILALLYALHTGHADQVQDVSLNKVCAFLAVEGDEILGFHSAYDTLKDAWDACKPAAHLWGGLFFVEHAMPRHTVASIAQTHTPLATLLDDLDLEHLGPIARPMGRVLLTMAAELQAYGLNFRPPRVRESQRRLDAKSLWPLTDVPDWGSAYHSKFQLTEDQLARYVATPVPSGKRKARSEADDL